MNTRSTWWLLGIAAVLLVCIVAFERDHAPGSQTPEGVRLLPGLVPSQVSRIEISAQETMRAERVDFQWRLTAPVVYPAQSQRIDVFLDACIKLEARTTIPAKELRSQPRGLADYGLQPPRGTVKLFQGGQTFELRLGALSPVGDSIYAQLAGEEDVRVIESTLLDSFPRAAAEWRERSLLNLNGQAFNRLEVRTGSGRGFEVTREAAGKPWQMTKPPPVKRADHARIELMARELQNWQVQQFVTDDPAIPLESFGLQPPVAELLIGQGTNDLVAVQFGLSPTNAPEYVFARRLSHTNLVLVKADWLRVLTQQFSEFRDRRLLSFNPTNAVRIDVAGTAAYSLLRQTNATWRMAEPLNFLCDAELVNRLLSDLQQLEITEFMKDVVTETDLTELGLVNPAVQIAVHGAMTNALPGATNAPLAELLIGTNLPNGTVVARRTDEASLYAIDLAWARQLPVNPYALRDRQVWSFNITNVVSLTATRAGLTRKLLREAGGNWKFAPGSQGSFEPAAVEEMTFRLGQLRAVSWVARGAAHTGRFGIPITGTRVEIELRGTDASQTLSLDFGIQSPTGGTYAATVIEGEPTVFDLPKTFYEELAHFLFPRPVNLPQ